MIIVLLHTKESNDNLQFLATTDPTTDPEGSKLYLPVTQVRKPNLKLSEATKAVLQRAAVPFSAFVYEGVIAVRNYYSEDTHHFDFVITCEYVGTGLITRSSIAVGGGTGPTIHCMFFPFEKVLESVRQTTDPLQYVLARWLERSPKKVLPVIKPHENYSWTGRALDLKAFILITNKNSPIPDSANSSSADANAVQVLLVENERGHLYLPGGRFGQDENLATSTIRLATQQTGYNIKIDAIHDIVYGWADYSPLHFFVVARIESGSVKTTPDEHSKGAKWVTREELLQQLSSQRGGEYQKMWELKGTITNFLENTIHNSHFIPIYG